MKLWSIKSILFKGVLVSFFCLMILISYATAAQAKTTPDELIYNNLMAIAFGKGDIVLFAQLNKESIKLDWNNAVKQDFEGNLRILKPKDISTFSYENSIYLIRKITGEIFILTPPENPDMLKEGADSAYAGINKMLQDKLRFKIVTVQGVINGQVYNFAKLIAKPEQVTLDKVFKIAIILMLFFVMVGMGLTLTADEFKLVFKQPKGIIFGAILQFGFMPLIALGLGNLMGFYQAFPFIFVGMILVTATPAGATSNLMTFFAKGDVALSISLTSFSTALSLIFTPLILALYCSNVPEVNMPVKIIVVTIFVLVLIPLIAGMLVRHKWKNFAKKATPFFSALGIIALLFIISAGILSNLHTFADTERYSLKFYSMLFIMTFLGMFLGALLSKLIGISNFQTRAIAMEIGIRNASLSMVIALLIQDLIGDFHSSMFITSGLYGLCMYIVGGLSIPIFKKLFVVEEKPFAKVDEN
jgi:predicted Na+-dependent transporter